MTFEDDFESEGAAVDLPAEMFDDDDQAVLAPVFIGHRMEAELVRSLLEANEIPAVIFGTGGFAFGAEDTGPNERVMVRSDHVEAALDAIRSAEPDGAIVSPTAEDIEVMVDDDFADIDIGTDYADGDIDAASPDDVDVLAQGSDWGPRIVGLVGIAALAVTAFVLISKAT